MTDFSCQTDMSSLNENQTYVKRMSINSPQTNYVRPSGYTIYLARNAFGNEKYGCLWPPFNK